MVSTCIYSLIRELHIASGQRALATAVATKLRDIEPETFRTFESHPPNHNETHLRKVYTVPTNIQTLMQDNVPNEWKQQIQTFVEFGILIRKPAVEIISYLEQTDYSKSIKKYVLYGKIGAGKTSTLLHTIHYGLAQKFIVLHVPQANTWFRFPKEVTDSPLMPDKLDLPLHAQAWLKYFKNLNEPLLSNIKISKDYVWNERESTPHGESLSSLIEFGIKRIKFACGVIDAVVDELKIASTAKKCRVLIVIDGFNTFFSDVTSIRDERKVYVPAQRISLTSSFLKCANYDWCNGAAILSVDKKANKTKRDSDYPRYLLGKEGFELLDPFLPINVEDYTSNEFKAIMEYYKDRKWVREITSQGQRELELLSNRNPLTLWIRCKPL